MSPAIADREKTKIRVFDQFIFMKMRHKYSRQCTLCYSQQNIGRKMLSRPVS